MDDKKEHNLLLSKKIVSMVFDFLGEDIINEYIVDDVINLLINSHIASLFASLKFISSNYKNYEKNLDEFIKGLNKHMDSYVYLMNSKIEKKSH